MADQPSSRTNEGNIIPAHWVSETEAHILGQIELELAFEVLDLNMGKADVKRVFNNQGGIALHDATIRYSQAEQFLTLSGHFPDGSPFELRTAPFDGCPVERAKQIATELTMPAPAQIKGLANTLREQLQTAIQRASQIGENAKAEVGNLHGVLNQADETIKDVAAASADIQSALGLNTNGGPPLDGTS